MPDIDPALAAAAAEIEASGKARYKDDWPVLVGAVQKVMPKNVNPADVLRAAIATEDAAGAFRKAGMEALASMASDGNAEAERTYSRIRAEERTAYRRSRGLIR